MQVGSDGKISSSGTGLDGVLAAWRSVVAIFTVEIPRLITALFGVR